jgi:methionyl-tRNA synthetase
VQKVLQTLFDNGAIYKGEYEGLYCVGCEQFKNESDLVDGKCPDHGIVPELLKEESYMMKLTDIQNELIQKIESNEFKISPEKYKNEILSFLKSQTLRDVSVSRKNVSWGIPLPFDETHTTYVWVDAFLNYLTGLGWDGDEKNIPEFWPVDVQLIGKDILRVHATIWPVILMHLGIKLPKLLFTHGHILSAGKKMSKTLGNAISIDEMLEKFGKDGTRYLLLSAGTFGEDVDVTMERLVEKYNADLANGLGNLISRIIKLAGSLSLWPELDIEKKLIVSGSHLYGRDKIFDEWVSSLKFDMALRYIWENFVKKSNIRIDETKPWELLKTNQGEFEKIMRRLLEDVLFIARCLESFMPETSEKIKKALEAKEIEPLFQRIK